MAVGGDTLLVGVAVGGDPVLGVAVGGDPLLVGVAVLLRGTPPAAAPRAMSPPAPASVASSERTSSIPGHLMTLGSRTDLRLDRKHSGIDIQQRKYRTWLSVTIPEAAFINAREELISDSAVLLHQVSLARNPL